VSRLYGLARSLVVYYGQPWKRRRMDRMYAEFIRPGDLCFDIGAHVGNRIRSFVSLGARVIAVEPQPDLVVILERLYGGHKDVVLLKCAIGAEDGTATLRISTSTPTLSSTSAGWVDRMRAEPVFRGVAWDKEVVVPMRTLASLIAEFGEPAFCKIDVEGSELDVLRGAGRPLRSVSFEYLPAAVDAALACVEELEANGAYRYRASPGESHRFLASGSKGQWWTAEEARAFLSRLAPGDRSGDMFAVHPSAART
jgi:FkbM family methyltransferase